MAITRTVFYGISLAIFVFALTAFEPLPRIEVCQRLYEGHPDCPRIAP